MKISNKGLNNVKYRFIFLITVGAVILILGRLAPGGGLFRFIGNYTIIPMQKGISYTGKWISDVAENFGTLEEIRSQNKDLQKEVDRLTVDNMRLRQEQYELIRLRELYKLDENYADYKKVGARVIARNGSTWFNDFVIDKGAKDGVSVNSNVLAGSGLVGIVIETGPDYARVRSIIDDSSHVSGMILSTSDTCIVSGDLKLIADGRLKFEKLANNDNKIEVGEQVVTSHISNRFVQGLFIGYISEINTDSNNLTKSGYITPAVDFSKIQEVLVITDVKSTAGAEEEKE